MRLLKVHSILKLANSYIIDSPQPSNINYFWNIGSLLAFCLIIQIITGVTLGMHYTPNIYEAFDSVEHIMRDVNNGWFIRYCHANTASAFFALVYLHISRGLYYGSYKAPRTIVWSIGVVIFLLMMATAFLGYKRSPKWYKNNNYNKNNNKNNKYNGKRYYSSTTAFKYNGKTVSKFVYNFLIEKNLKPIYLYEDLHLQETKDTLRKNVRDISGIYLILNKITGDYYIGSASTDRFYSRFYKHLISLDGSKIVKLAIRKYKLTNFAFIILELFPEKINKENNKKLLDLEDFYLKSLLPNYNILTEAGSSFGYKHTEIDRIKMKDNYSQKRRDAIGNLNKDKLLSVQVKDRMREKALSRSKRVFTNEALNNMKKSSKAIILYNKNDNTVFGEYNSIIEAANSIKCSYKTIRRALVSDSKILLRRFVVKLK